MRKNLSLGKASKIHDAAMETMGRHTNKKGGAGDRNYSTHTRQAICEALEDRQMLSLTIDLRQFPTETKQVAVTSVGQVVQIQIWATITSSNGIPTQDFLQDIGGSILSAKLGSGSINGNLKAQNVPDFGADGAVPGVIQDLNGDGNLDVGGNNPSADPFPFFFARSGSPTHSTSPDAEIVGNALEFVIGTLNYTVTGLGNGGETDINFRPENNTGNIGAVWGEDGVGVNSMNGQFLAGAPLVVTDPAIAPPPVAVPTSFYAQQGAPTRITPLSVDTSVDSLVPTSIVVTSPPADGTLALQPDGSLIYTSNAGYLGTDSFTYTVMDIDGFTSNSAKVSLTVGSIASPVAGNISVIAPQAGFADVDVLGSDSAATGLTLNPASVALVSPPQDGTAVVQPNGSIVYTPNIYYQGNDSFTYVVDDSLGHPSNVATVTLSVQRASAPVAANVTTSTQPGNPVNVDVLSRSTASPGLTLIDNGLDIVTQPANGNAAPTYAYNNGIDAPTGTITYTPNGGFTGIDTFTYTVSDSSGTPSAPATVTVYVTNGTVVLHPVAYNDSASTISNTPVTVNLLANDTATSFSSFNPASLTIGTSPAHGTTTILGNGSVVYTPAKGFAGSDSFTYTVADTTGQVTNSATVNITVLGKLTGTVIGTSGSYHNLGNTIANVFDGNLSTYFDAPTGNGNWVGLDLGKEYSISEITYSPRSGWANRMVGGEFQGSNDPNFKTGVVALGTIVSTPTVGVYTTMPVSVTGAFRYVRYLSPTASYGNVAEIQFVGTPATNAPTELTGTVIGTAGSYQNQGNTIANVFDGNLSTFFDAPVGTGAWVGLDLGSAQTISQISFAPRSGFAYRMVGGEFQVSNSANFSSGAVTLYTVTTNPSSNVLTTINVNVTGEYRYIRYIGPANACCNISEMVVYG